MSADIKATPTITPMACGALNPSESSVEPAVHAVVLILSEYLSVKSNFSRSCNLKS